MSAALNLLSAKAFKGKGALPQQVPPPRLGGVSGGDKEVVRGVFAFHERTEAARLRVLIAVPRSKGA